MGAWPPPEEEWAIPASPPVGMPGSMSEQGTPIELARMPSLGVPAGLAQPTAKFFMAALAAQMKAQTLEEKGEVAFKKTRYTYATAKQFIQEGRRVLHENGLMLFQLGAIGAPDSKSRRTVLYSTFVIVHAESGEGIVVPFEWVIAPTEKMAPPKALGAAYTSSLRYFLRSFLQIATGDHEDPEQAYPQPGQPTYGHPAPGYAPPQQQHVHALPPQYAPPPPQHAPPPHRGQQFQQPPGPPPQAAGYPPPQAPPPPPRQAYGPPPGAPPAHGLPAQPPPPQGWGDQANYQGPGGGAPPFANAPGSAQPTGGPPPDQGDAPAPRGVPQGAEEWTMELIRVGWAPGLAEDLARVELDKPIHAGISEILHAEIEKVFGGNVDAARAAWEGTGFTPRPEAKDRPVPTGHQALLYARKIKDTNHQEQTA